MAQAFIILRPKKGDLALCKNWRPNSLANADYKLLVAVLSARLSAVLERVIRKEQAGLLRGRSLFDAILTVSRLARRLALFTWNANRLEPVSRRRLHSAMADGGLGLPSIGISA